jgi:hypothetical protein
VTADAGEKEEQEHGPEQAAYMLTGPGPYQPTIICMCGEACSADTWEDAGAEFDRHLEEFPS